MGSAHARHSGTPGLGVGVGGRVDIHVKTGDMMRHSEEHEKIYNYFFTLLTTNCYGVMDGGTCVVFEKMWVGKGFLQNRT